MKYNPSLDAAVIPMDELKSIGTLLLDALVEIRNAYELPLDKYERSGPLTRSDHAQKGIIEIGDRLGIELGARWGNEIDLRDHAV